MGNGKRYKKKRLTKSEKYYIIGVISFIALLIIIMILSGINSKRKANSKIAQIENIINETSDATLVSSTDDKTINEVEEAVGTEETEKTEEELTPKIAINTSNINESIQGTPIITEEKKKELHFSVPLEGEILKDYSDNNLVFSETLQEWVVHLGVDIEAEKATPVLASERGIVESIKNDPRYGLTITIKHENDFKTIYSNLQTAEFVTEGQEVEKGKVIGSVGDNAAFEIAEEPHLHFEMLKNGENVNPTLYWE